MTNSTTRQITYFTFVRCFHKWKSMLFRRKKKIYHHTDSTAGGTKAEASNATTSIQPPQRETRWFPCLREMSQSPKSPNADHKPHTGLVLPPCLWLGLCPAPLHGSRHLLPSHPCSRHRESQHRETLGQSPAVPAAGEEGTCQWPAENYCPGKLSPFLFTWFSVDRASPAGKGQP